MCFFVDNLALVGWASGVDVTMSLIRKGPAGAVRGDRPNRSNFQQGSVN